MAAAAAEFATVFLETSLGTRLVVSFPAFATTVADLKRQVTAEHAACFPQSGPIAVKSLKVKHDGSLFHLTDSMVVEGAFRWVQGPWHLLVEARELGPHPLAREDADCGNGGGSEQNSDNPDISDSTQNMSPPAVSLGGGNLAIGDGVRDTPLLNQLDENHEDVECAPDQLKDENVVPQESSDDLYLAAGGSGTPSMDQQDRSHESVAKHAMGQQKDGIVKAMLQGCSDLRSAAGDSDNAVDLQDKSCKGVKHASVQPEDDNVKTMLQESSGLNKAECESDSRAKNQLDKSHEDVKHALSLCKDANVKTMLKGSSSLDVAAGECQTLLMNQEDKCYKGVKHASGQHKTGNVNAMFHENSDLHVVGGEDETPPMNQLDKSYESVKHASVQSEGGNVKTMPEKSFDVAAGEGETPSMNQQDKSFEGVKHALRRRKKVNVKTMPEETPDFDVASSESKTPPMNQLDKSHEDVRYASGKLEDGTVNFMLQKCSGLDESAAAKDKGSVRSQQKDVIAEPRGTELFRKEDKNDESIIGNCDDNISFPASSTINISLSEKKSSGIEEENLKTNPLVYNQESYSHGMGEKPSGDQKEPWTSEVCNGESSNGVSDILPCVRSMDRDNSSNGEVNAHRSGEEEPRVTGLCSGESSFKETDAPHCTESMKEGNKRQTYNDRFLKKRKHEGATTTNSTENESCFKRRQQQVLVARKVPMSKAAKIFGLRC